MNSTLSRIIVGVLAALSVANARAQPAAPDNDPVVLSPFSVNSARDYGYRATNTLTATRTGVEVFRTPLNVSVLTEDFLRDIDAQNLNESLNFVTSVSTASLGNNGRIGGSGDGTRIRGFPISYVLRNGYRRDRGVAARNVERIEVVKGPVSLLFGQTTPGGLMNYITKRPSFADKSSVTLTAGSENLLGYSVDVDRSFTYGSKKSSAVAFRVMGAQDQRDFYRDFEFQDDDYVIGQLALRPVSTLNVLLEHEYLERTSNLAQGLPRTNPQYKADWARAVAEGRLFDTNNWYGSVANWMDDIQARTGVRPPSANTFDRSSYPPGQFATYNLGGPDQRFNSRSNSTSLEADWKATEALSVRYGLNRYDVFYFEKFVFNDRPNADGTARMGEIASRNNGKVITTHQADVVFRHDFRAIKNTFVAGAEWLNDYETDRRLAFNPSQGFTAEGVSRALPAPGRPNQGAVLNAVNSFDPSVQPIVRLNGMITSLDNPTGKVIVDQDRAGYYASYRAGLLEDKLQLSAGVRREDVETARTAVVSGVTSANEVADTTTSFGVNYEFVRGFTAFASRSESFIPTTGSTVTGGLVRPGEAQPLPPESGSGIELGMKVSLPNNTVTGTVSYFALKRENISTRDLDRARSDPRNADPNAPDGVAFPFLVNFLKPAGEAEVEGLDAELLWSPSNRLQLLFSATHYLRAEFTNMTPLLTTGRLPNTANPAATGVTRVNAPVSIDGTRLPRTPDWSLSTWAKYTFAAQPVRGLSLGVGLQYRSEYVLFGAASPGTGSDDPYSTYDFRDFKAGSYALVDVAVGYPLKVWSKPIHLNLTVKNVLDKEYLGGTYTFGEPRRFALTARFDF